VTCSRPDVAAAWLDERQEATQEALAERFGTRAPKPRRRSPWPKRKPKRLADLERKAMSASSHGVRLIAAAVLDACAESPGSPVGVVLHVPAYPGRVSLDALDHARRLSGGKSTHANIATDGTTYLPVPHTHQAGHAGGPWNAAMLGIDFASPGPVSLHGGRLYRPGTRMEGGRRVIYWRGKAYPEAPQAHPDGSPLTLADCLDFGDRRRHWPWGRRWWHVLSPAQIYAAARLIHAWRTVYPRLQSGLILRHSDIAPQSRCDPGPCVPLELLRRVVSDASTPIQDSILCDALGYPERAWRELLLAEWYAGGDEPGRTCA